jgi:hypothetical protein
MIDTGNRGSALPLVVARVGFCRTSDDDQHRQFAENPPRAESSDLSKAALRFAN